MLLRRVIEHVKAQNWTAVSIDFVIVVAGVLLALWASEWAAARQGLAAAKRAQDTIETELFDASRAVYNFNSSIPCSLELLSALEAALVSDGQTPEILTQDRGFIPFGLVIPPTLARDQATASGAMAHVPRDKQVAYRSVYGRLETIGEITGRLNERADVFAPLIMGRPMTEPERNAMLSDLRWMRTRLRIVESVSEQMFDELAPLDLEQRIDPRRAEEFSVIINELREVYGGCVRPPDIEPYKDYVE
ncbi:hypothetical protein [Hyphococcus sp.]|uniref:hypothetical protein n=1 Tax=Hyphococcus sp. TaxID=2038636 RepID=UPI003D0D643F